MAFGDAAKAWESWGYGHKISKNEAIDILAEVREKGRFILSFMRKRMISLPVAAICNCCWDCCGILKPYNMGSVPLMYNASYIASIKDDANCKECGNCAKYCPTTAMKMKDKEISFDKDKCIGCGQCAFQCRQNNIEVHQDEGKVYLPIMKKADARVTA